MAAAMRETGRGKRWRRSLAAVASAVAVAAASRVISAAAAGAIRA